jgi:hypothetical protein
MYSIDDSNTLNVFIPNYFTSNDLSDPLKPDFKLTSLIVLRIK